MSGGDKLTLRRQASRGTVSSQFGQSGQCLAASQVSAFRAEQSGAAPWASGKGGAFVWGENRRELN